MYDSLYCFFSADQHNKDKRSLRSNSSPRPNVRAETRRECEEGTFVFLQATDLFENGLQVHVEAMAVAEQLQEVTGANRAACVVDEFTGRGQPVGEDFKLLPLRERETKMLSPELRELQEGENMSR